MLVTVAVGLFAAVDEAVQLLAPLSEKPPIVEDVVIELTVSNGPKAGADVLRRLDAAEVAIAGLALREPSLDDVFLSLTGHKTTIEQDEDEAAPTKKRFGRGRKSDVTDGKDAA